MMSDRCGRPLVRGRLTRILITESGGPRNARTAPAAATAFHPEPNSALTTLFSTAQPSDAETSPNLLWTPSEEWTRSSTFARYLEWLARERGLRFSGYREVWEWSTRDIEKFWASVWDFFEIRASQPYRTVLEERTMPGAKWFTGAELNYAEHSFRHAMSDRPALYHQSEIRPLGEMSWAELHHAVASVAASLRAMGVGQGDRVAAYLPNVPEAVVAFLATASLGAVWSSCSPDFGARSVIERLQQIEPKVLIAVDGYRYAGKPHDRLAVVEELRRSLPTLEETVLLPYLDETATVEGARLWSDLLGREEPLHFDAVPFDHPLWILYSSGTTGTPKAIVHSHGGILVEQLKSLCLQADMRPGDRFLWVTTTGWMMWNVLVGGLISGAAPVLFDGSVAHPDLGVLWRLVERTRTSRFGASPGFYGACMKAGMQPGREFDLTALRSVGASGSPLPLEVYRWVYDAVSPDVWLASSSGGTDVASAFVGGCPTLPVYEGEMQGPFLGVLAQAFDSSGHPVVDEVGELVITEPMPSMPIYFWNDPGDARYRETYFEMFPGVWRHGDWIRFTPRGGAIIYGRSDSTLNRFGVRIGTSEVYRAVEALSDVVDSLVVGVEQPGGGYYMPLFVVLPEGRSLDDRIRDTIRQQIRSTFTPRHLPDEIVQAPGVPRTLSGKKLEVPIKRLLMGQPLERVVNLGSLANPDALDFYVRFAAERGPRAG
jgi:acetoacetyl-CoA synthetase